MSDPILHTMDCPGGQEGEKRVCFWCPGCKCGHWVRVAGTAGVWGFNGNFDKPTFAPSILCKSGASVCHSHVTDGSIQFLADCTHEFAGKIVPMEPF